MCSFHVLEKKELISNHRGLFFGNSPVVTKLSRMIGSNNKLLTITINAAKELLNCEPVHTVSFD